MKRFVFIVTIILFLFISEALANKYLYISDQNGLLYQLDIELKSTKYISNLGVYLSDISILDDYKLIGISFNSLYSISPSGQAIFKTDLSISDANSLGKPKNYSKLYLGCRNGDLYLLDSSSYGMLFIGNLGGGWGYSGDIAFDPGTGEMYASVNLTLGSIDYLAKVDKITGRGTLIGPINYQSVFGLEFDSDGNLYGVTTDGWILKIDPATGNGTPLFYHGIAAQGMTFSEIEAISKTYFPPGYSQAWTYDAQSQENILSAEISTNGDYIAIGISDKSTSPEKGKLNLFSSSGTLLWQYQTAHPVIDISMSADVSKIVAGASSGYFGGGAAYHFNLTGELLDTTTTCCGVSSVSYSPERNYFAMTYDHGLGWSDRVALWGYNEGKWLWYYTVGDSETGDVSVSAEGEYIAVGAAKDVFGNGGSVYLYNKSGNLLWKYTIEQGTLSGDKYSVAVSSDGQYVAAGNAENNLLYFFNRSGQLLWSYDTGYIKGLSISPNGNYILAASTNTVYMFDPNGNLLWNLEIDGIQDVAISTDANSIVLATAQNVYLFRRAPSCNLSGTLKDAITGKPLPGITIIIDDSTSLVTDSNGNYSIPKLPCGTHTLTVNISGYASYSWTVDTSVTSTLDILLTKNETVYGSQTPSGYGPDPVNTSTGNYIFQRSDLAIPGRGLNFVFQRNYNSQDATDGPLGYGWTHSYNSSLTVNPDSTVTIRWGDGKIETWTPDGSGGLTPQYGVYDTLIANGNGTHTLKKKDLTNYNFDTSGILTSILDKNGNIITLTYSRTNLTQITDTVGRNITLTYDGNNRITQITDPIGRTLKFAYVANGDLVSSTDMNGKTTSYTYDDSHQLLTVVDPRGNTVVTNTYDSQRRVVTSQKDAKSGETKYTYDEINRKTIIQDALGYTTIHFHDDLLRLIQETDARGNSAFYTYDSAGDRTEVKDKNGNLTKYFYDARGNVLTKTDPLNNVTTITYDTNNNPLSREDALVNTTTFEYDAKGNLLKTTNPLGYFTTVTYDSYGQPIIITDARGKTTTNTYNLEGNLTQVADAIGKKTIYTYDGVGRKLTIKDALNHTTAYTYDSNNNLLTVTDPMGYVTTYAYDANNNRLTVTDPRSNTTSYAYDVKNLLTTTTDPLGKTITNTYDALDRKISFKDKKGSTTTFVYDEVGNLLTRTDALSNSTTYSYDPNGNKLTETNPLSQTITYVYDKLNRVTSVTDPLSSATTTIYDALGKVTSTNNAKGQTTSFEYDAMGRLKKVTDANSKTVIFTYDANGNRLTMTDPNGNTTSYTYDDLTRLIQKVEPLGSTYQYVYDQVGNRVSLTDAKGNIINYTYDANNRLTLITYPDASTVSLAYDQNGNRTQMVDSLGTSTYAFDKLNRMTSYTDPFGKAVGYGYDANGNRTTLTYPGTNVVNYTYDALNRLIRVTDWVSNSTFYYYDQARNLVNTINPNGTTATYSYDVASRLIGLSNSKSDMSVISSYTYTLDSIGNHLQVVQNEPLNPTLPPKNITLTYDKENRLTNAGGVTFTYDSNGNITGKGSDTFVYDFEDRLTQSTIAGINSQYGYDGVGNRFVRTEGGVTKKYILDVNGRLSNVLAETDSNETIAAYYVYGLGLISKVLPNGTTYNFHYDSRGSTIALTDDSQTITDAYAYDSFGKLSNSTGSTLNPFKYVGRYGVMEEGNGLKYIRARYYAPELGRFINKDLLVGNEKDGRSLNRYIYSLNCPIILIDTNGAWAHIVAGAGLGALWGFVGTAIGDVTTSIVTGETHISRMEEYIGNILGGAAGGAVLATTGNVILAGAAEGAVSNFSTQTLEMITGERPKYEYDIGSYVQDVVVSASLSGILDKVGPQLTRPVGKPATQFTTKFISGKNIIYYHAQEVLDITVENLIRSAFTPIPANAFSNGVNTPYIPESTEAQANKNKAFYK